MEEIYQPGELHQLSTKGKGGRGLRSLEKIYKVTKIERTMKLFLETDHRLDLVRDFRKVNIETNSFSIFKDTLRYASKIGLS